MNSLNSLDICVWKKLYDVFDSSMIFIVIGKISLINIIIIIHNNVLKELFIILDVFKILTIIQNIKIVISVWKLYLNNNGPIAFTMLGFNINNGFFTLFVFYILWLNNFWSISDCFDI